jgi:hypothetical protein
MVFYERIEALLDTLYKGSRPEEREKREALSRIVRYASRQRGAWMNCEIVSPLSFILLNGIVGETRDLARLMKRIEALEKETN